MPFRPRVDGSYWRGPWANTYICDVLDFSVLHSGQVASSSVLSGDGKQETWYLMQLFLVPWGGVHATHPVIVGIGPTTCGCQRLVSESHRPPPDHRIKVQTSCN
jgi:hypothetical protein